MTAHLFVSHFPVALLTTGAAADLAGTALRNPDVRRFASALLVLGAAAALLAFFTGQGAVHEVLGRVSPVDPRLEMHARWGGAGVWVLAAAGALRAMWWKRLEGPRGWAALAAALASAGVVGAMAYTGAAISHGR
jgi:uncharacterized membrane protein